MTDEKIQRCARVTGTDRERLRIRIAGMYLDRQMSIRQISSDTGRSYGAVHGLLVEEGVELRPRGNPHG